MGRNNDILKLMNTQQANNQMQISFDFEKVFPGTNRERILLNERMMDQLKYNNTPIEIGKFYTNQIDDIFISLFDIFKRDKCYFDTYDVYISMIEDENRNLEVGTSYIEYCGLYINVTQFPLRMLAIIEDLSKKIYLDKFKVIGIYDRVKGMVFDIISTDENITLFTIDEFYKIKKQYLEDLENMISKSNTIFISTSMMNKLNELDPYNRNFHIVNNKELETYFLRYNYNRDYEDYYYSDYPVDLSDTQLHIPIREYTEKILFFFKAKRIEYLDIDRSKSGFFDIYETLFYFLARGLCSERIGMKNLCIEFGDTIKSIYETRNNLAVYKQTIKSKEATNELIKAKIENRSLALNLMRTLCGYIRPLLDDKYNIACGKLDVNQIKIEEEDIINKIRSISQETKYRQEFLDMVKK